MSDPSGDRLGVRSFLRAAQERKVWGVAAAYLVVGYGIIEASELIFPRLQFSVFQPLTGSSPSCSSLSRWRFLDRGR